MLGFQTNFVNRYSTPELFDYDTIEENTFEKVVDWCNPYLNNAVTVWGAVASIWLMYILMWCGLGAVCFTAPAVWFLYYIFGDDVCSYIYLKSQKRRAEKQKQK